MTETSQVLDDGLDEDQNEQALLFSEATHWMFGMYLIFASVWTFICLIFFTYYYLVAILNGYSGFRIEVEIF
jgi:hypothetical protein